MGTRAVPILYWNGFKMGRFRDLGKIAKSTVWTNRPVLATRGSNSKNLDPSAKPKDSLIGDLWVGTIRILSLIPGSLASLWMEKGWWESWQRCFRLMVGCHLIDIPI